jgi:hypothetical protein
MATTYKWDVYSDKYIRNHPKNEAEEELAEHQATNVVKEIIERLESEERFGKKVLQKLAPHVLKAMGRPSFKEEDEHGDRGETLV